MTLARSPRWRDPYSVHRTNAALYDLIDAENVRARSIASAVDTGEIDLAKVLSKKDAPIRIINELLQLSNLPIEISVQQNDQIVASKSGGNPYSIAQLSDGERNALLVGAAVLTVKPGTLVLLDEPERHLHRSIISPLLTLLFEKRRDCAFIVSTHEVMLPLDNPAARTLLLRECIHTGSNVSAWDTDLVPAEAEIDEDAKRDILGGRRKLLLSKELNTALINRSTAWYFQTSQLFRNRVAAKLKMQWSASKALATFTGYKHSASLTTIDERKRISTTSRQKASTHCQFFPSNLFIITLKFSVEWWSGTQPSRAKMPQRG